MGVNGTAGNSVLRVGKVQQRLGLTIKRRAHFTNIYAPFCPDCGQAAESKKALQTHLAMAHGKRLAHYKRKENSAVLGNLSRPLNIESLDLKGKLPKEYLSDMKRIWRLSGVGHSDLVLVERITRKSEGGCAVPHVCRDRHERPRRGDHDNPQAQAPCRRIRAPALGPCSENPATAALCSIENAGSESEIIVACAG